MEERLAKIFTLLEDYNIKVNLIETSAIKMNLCVDNSRHLLRVIVMFEMDGVAEEVAQEAMRLAGHKLPIKTKFVSKDTEVKEG